MYSPHYYPAPPQGYSPYGYTSPPTSPSYGPQMHFSPRYSKPAASTMEPGTPRRHSRRTSQDPEAYRFSSPRYSTGYHHSPGWERGHAVPDYASREQDADYVSVRERTNLCHGRAKRPSRRATSVRYVYHDDYDGSSDSEAFESSGARPGYMSYRRADVYPQREQVPVYVQAEPSPRRSRARRSTGAGRTAPPPKPAMAASPPQATEADARRANIPAGYSLKNWDPTEEPIILLGSVFDAYSLGKWIYDWTVFHHGPSSPISDIAGELWLLLIQLAGKVKRAEECLPRIRNIDDREMLGAFLESGDRLWSRFRKLLKACEEYMWKTARRDGGEKKSVSMGKNAGLEFVDSIFGRDRELERTEKLMTGMRLWSMRFDVNCEGLLRRPRSRQ